MEYIFNISFLMCCLRITLIALLCGLCGCNSIRSGIGSSACPITIPDERDQDVLTALLLHLLHDNRFGVGNKSMIVLHARSPTKTGALMASQINSDLNGYILPNGAELDLRRRNMPRSKQSNFVALSVVYTNLAFADGIIVVDLFDNESQKHDILFSNMFPDAKAWLVLYLPGFSHDGAYAVVRGSVGPWAHAAMLTALLKKDGREWVVEWYNIARYL